MVQIIINKWQLTHVIFAFSAVMCVALVAIYKRIKIKSPRWDEAYVSLIILFGILSVLFLILLIIHWIVVLVPAQ